MVIVLVMKVVNNNYSYTKFMKYKIIITINIVSDSKFSLLIIMKPKQNEYENKDNWNIIVTISWIDKINVNL